MKKLLALGVVALVVVGIVKLVGAHTTEGKARRACENVVSQCESLARLGGEKLDSSDLDECASDLADEKSRLGESYDDMVDCVIEADSCGEVIGCVGGAFINEIGDELKGMGKGFEKMTRKR